MGESVVQIRDIEHFHWQLSESECPISFSSNGGGISLAAAVELALIAAHRRADTSEPHAKIRVARNSIWSLVKESRWPLRSGCADLRDGDSTVLVLPTADDDPWWTQRINTLLADLTANGFAAGLAGNPLSDFLGAHPIYDHLKDDIAWCERDWQILSPGRALAVGWERFSEAVKHETRFLFFTSTRDPYESGEPFEVRPDEMLDELGKAIRKCRLVRKVPAGTRLFRVRGHKKGKRYATPKELGPPPRQYAVSAGRMNAPGIVVMYGALEEETAFSEATGEFKFYSVAEFELLEDLLVVDLSRVPQVPSIFEDKPRESIIFLRDFKKDVSRPITPDQEVHIEYTPTQVVSEYLRHRFRNASDKTVSGVLYESAKAKGGKNVALFIESERVEGVRSESFKPKTPLLRLLNVKERRPVSKMEL